MQTLDVSTIRLSRGQSERVMRCVFAGHVSRKGGSKMKTCPFAAFVGIDWADEEHAVCLLLPGQDEPERTTVPQQAEEIDAWVAALRARFGKRPVAVCMEISRGPLAYALMKYVGLVLFPINPKQLAKYREAFAPSGPKDDPGDALAA
ncbi:MAG: hypothetical protein DCC68_11650 [Planctomycetota bacterium]|nr:MAG: hypothetical protein DCC68_11650 [Planctomycetota bacterium]